MTRIRAALEERLTELDVWEPVGLDTDYPETA